MSKEKILLCNDIILEQIIEDGENYDNFLNPEFVKKIKEEKVLHLKNALFGKKKIWKPSKYEFPKHVRQLLLT